MRHKTAVKISVVFIIDCWMYKIHAGYRKLKILTRLERVLLWRQIGEMRMLTCNILLFGLDIIGIVLFLFGYIL